MQKCTQQLSNLSIATTLMIRSLRYHKPCWKSSLITESWTDLVSADEERIREVIVFVNYCVVDEDRVRKFLVCRILFCLNMQVPYLDSTDEETRDKVARIIVKRSRHNDRWNDELVAIFGLLKVRESDLWLMDHVVRRLLAYIWTFRWIFPEFFCKTETWNDSNICRQHVDFLWEIQWS